MNPPTPAPAARAFSRHAPDYDAQRRRLVPPYDAFYGAAADVVSLRASPGRRLLDLGAGTGLLSEALVTAEPGATVELVDASAEMLQGARERLGAAVVAVHVQDLREPLPAGPFDAIASALAIHHLEHEEQRDLLRRVHERLTPGGVFVNAEQVAAPSTDLDEIYEQMWARHCSASGATPRELDDARERMRHDRCAPTGAQLDWLRDAGFTPVACVFASWHFAVLAGWRPEP
ncbi:MAG: class I SAM-dependent methyltransferase [Solirubrobacteraceae bacterium]